MAALDACRHPWHVSCYMRDAACKTQHVLVPMSCASKSSNALQLLTLCKQVATSLRQRLRHSLHPTGIWRGCRLPAGLPAPEARTDSNVVADWLTVCCPPCMQVSFAPFKATLTGDAGGQLSQKYLVSSSSGGVQPSPFDVENALWFSWTQPNAFDSQKDAATAFHTFLQGVSLDGRHDSQLLP